MTKYQDYYKQMVASHQQLFSDFKKINEQFALAPTQHEVEFQRLGQQVVDIIREFDRRLCSAMGRGAFSQYSQRLSEKFWALVRKNYSQIDMVGVKVKNRA